MDKIKVYQDVLNEGHYKLLSDNLYDFVGTDTHHKKHLNLLKKIGDKKTIKLIDNLIIRNKSFK